MKRMALLVVLLTVTACSSGRARGTAVDPHDWNSVRTAARGQTVNWYMYGGDDTLNRFVAGYVTAALRAKGVTLHQVRVADTGDAVNTVLGQKQAGRTSGGAVDAIWINGENFATGVQAKLWYCGWAGALPNARYVDLRDPAVARDFGVPVNGCESAWQQANSALVYDSRALGARDVRSVDSLIAWAKAHPGRFAYPSPPDFTGSMAVRTVYYDTAGRTTIDDASYASSAPALWRRLNDLEPALWRGGKTYPQSQDAVEKLYADGEISAFFTYGPGAVADQVRQGRFPKTTREAVLSVGNIANVSNIAIPADAAHRAGALVLADVLQDPQTQLALYRAEGIYPAIDVARTDAATKQAFAAVPVSPSVLPLSALSAHAVPEPGSEYVTRLERDWKSDVLQR